MAQTRHHSLPHSLGVPGYHHVPHAAEIAADDGLFRNEESSETSILHAIFPITARRLDEGLIVGRERVITKKNGTARWDVSAGEWDFTIVGSTWDNRNPLRPPLSRDTGVVAAVTSKTHSAVLQTFGRNGLLNSSTVAELSAQATVVVTVKTPGDVVIVSLKLKTDDVQFDGVLVAGVSLFQQTGVCFSRQIDR